MFSPLHSFILAIAIIHLVSSAIINCSNTSQTESCQCGKLSFAEESCVLSCDGDYSCYLGKTLICSDDHPCEVLCRGNDACQNVIVYGQKATSLNMVCDSQRGMGSKASSCCWQGQVFAANITGNVELDCFSPNDDSNTWNGNCYQMDIKCGSGDCSINCGSVDISESCGLMNIDASLSVNYECSGTECDDIASIMTPSPSISISLPSLLPTPSTNILKIITPTILIMDGEISDVSTTQVDEQITESPEKHDEKAVGSVIIYGCIIMVSIALIFFILVLISFVYRNNEKMSKLKHEQNMSCVNGNMKTNTHMLSMNAIAEPGAIIEDNDDDIEVDRSKIDENKIVGNLHRDSVHFENPGMNKSDIITLMGVNEITKKNSEEINDIKNNQINKIQDKMPNDNKQHIVNHHDKQYQMEEYSYSASDNFYERYAMVKQTSMFVEDK